MSWLRQSTAVTLLIGPFVDEADGKTAEIALTIAQADVRLSKNGGNMAQKGDATSCTHDEIGYYTCPVSTTDTDTLGILKVMVHKTGALPVWHEYMVVPANVWDSMFGADMLKVDVHAIDDDETAADNAEAFFDGTGYAGTGNVIPTVTTLTGHTAQTGDNYARLGAPAGASVSADVAAVKAETATIPTAAANADAVWDEATSGHVSNGTFGKLFGVLRKLLFNKSVDSGTSVEHFDDDNTTSLGTSAWADGTGTRGKNTVTW